MAAAHQETTPETAPPPGSDAGAAERRCIVTGATLPREALIRFVAGPDGRVWPDLQEKLPGRGFWVSCVAEHLETAIRKKLFAKAARTALRADETLLEQVRDQLACRLQQLLGLARRSGALVTGFAQVEPAIAHGKIALLLIATDAGADGRAKLAAKLPPAQILSPLASQQLGPPLGHDYLVYVGLPPGPFTAQVAQAARRLIGFIKENIAPEASLAQIGPRSQDGKTQQRQGRHKPAAAAEDEIG